MSDLLLVDRINADDDSTRSLIYIQGEPTDFKSLEDKVRIGQAKIKHETAIPAGRYPLALYDSPRFAREYYTKDDVNIIPRKEWEKLTKATQALYHRHAVIWVKNVPGFEYILIHWGNTSADTDGCLLVGSSFGKLGNNPAVLASRDAYVKFYAIVAPLVRAGGQFIEYRNSFLLRVA